MRRSAGWKTSPRAPRAVGVFLVAGAIAVPPATAQSLDMNFFVAVEGPTWGADLGALEVTDQHCHDLAYAQGFGHLDWRAYLSGAIEDGEADQVARERIGAGPWYNFYGTLIAEDLAQLHSDENGLWFDTAVTVTGEAVSEDVLEIPWGSELDGQTHTRAGPFFCFGVPE